MKKARTDVSVVYTSEDGTVYDSTDGWRIESYGSDKILGHATAHALLDHLVGTAAQRQRHGEAEQLGGLKIDHQLDSCRLLHRQGRWLFAL